MSQPETPRNTGEDPPAANASEPPNSKMAALAVIGSLIWLAWMLDFMNETPAEVAKRVGEGQPANTATTPQQPNDYAVPVIGDRQAAELSASEAQGACVWMARDEGMEPRNSPPPINRVDGGWVWTDFSRDGSQSWSCVLKDEGIHLLKTPLGMTSD